MEKTTNCNHMNFFTNTQVFRLEDKGQFQAEIQIKCTDCGEPFKFVGLPMGVNLHGATVSPDLITANLAILPLTEEDKKRVAIMNPGKGGKQ